MRILLESAAAGPAPWIWCAELDVPIRRVMLDVLPGIRLLVPPLVTCDVGMRDRFGWRRDPWRELVGEVGDLMTGMREVEGSGGFRRFEEVCGEDSSSRKLPWSEECFLLRFMLLLTGIEDEGTDDLRAVGDVRRGTDSAFGLDVMGEVFWTYCTCRCGGGLVDDSSEDLFSSLSSSSSSLLKNRL